MLSLAEFLHVLLSRPYRGGGVRPLKDENNQKLKPCFKSQFSLWTERNHGMSLKLLIFFCNSM